MTRRERVLRAFRREAVDRLPTQSNYTPAMGAKLAAHFQIPIEELPQRLDNHLVRVELKRERRLSEDGRTAFDWWGAGWSTETEGYWHTFGPLAQSEDLDGLAWPDPDAPELLDDARRAVAERGAEYFAAPNLGMCLFERAWSLRGFDQLLLDFADRPDWVEELLERITDIQIALIRRYIEAGVDGGYFGDDYGAQRSMLFSPRLWRRMFKPRLARLFEPFREAGLPVILHSDGDIRAILPDLVEIGITALNPVQPEVLEHAWLQKEYGERLAFYGGISTQGVLPSGTAEEVRAAVEECLRTLAPRGTGLMIGPSHRMQTDIAGANVAAMLEAFPKEAGGKPR
ncbi:MAG: uroporphyrinogen decarboxylase family protein [Bryobacteraceae bacterium]